MCFTHRNFAKVLNHYQYNFNIGDIIAGTIFSQEEKGYLIDIGANNAAYLPNEEIYLTKVLQHNLISSETQEFFILAYNARSKQLILSLKRLKYIRGWERIKQLQLEDIVLDLEIKSLNKGGVLVDIEEIQGFIPNSHLAYMVSKETLINTKVMCKFLIADEQYNQLILSNRCAKLKHMLHKIKIGSQVRAPVTEIKPYGVFFNVNNIPALLHISEMEKQHITNFEQIFAIGTKWLIKVIHIDTKQGRLSVSTNR